MNKITQQERSLLKLIQRSADSGDGWRKVSPVIWPHVKDTRPDLAEVKTEGDVNYIRITPTGITILEYT